MEAALDKMMQGVPDTALRFAEMAQAHPLSQVQTSSQQICLDLMAAGVP